MIGQALLGRRRWARARDPHHDPKPIDDHDATTVPEAMLVSCFTPTCDRIEGACATRWSGGCSLQGGDFSLDVS